MLAENTIKKRTGGKKQNKIVARIRARSQKRKEFDSCRESQGWPVKSCVQHGIVFFCVCPFDIFVPLHFIGISSTVHDSLLRFGVLWPELFLILSVFTATNEVKRITEGLRIITTLVLRNAREPAVVRRPSGSLTVSNFLLFFLFFSIFGVLRLQKANAGKWERESNEKKERKENLFVVIEILTRTKVRVGRRLERTYRLKTGHPRKRSQIVGSRRRIRRRVATAGQGTGRETPRLLLLGTGRRTRTHWPTVFA